MTKDAHKDELKSMYERVCQILRIWNLLIKVDVWRNVLIEVDVCQILRIRIFVTTFKNLPTKLIDSHICVFIFG